MATAVGKKFPDLNVDAMNEMGDTFKVNVLEEAVSNKKKVCVVLVPKRFYVRMSNRVARFSSSNWQSSKKETQ